MVRSAKDFFKPLAVGAPQPLREIPVRPSRVIHFFPPSNAKMVGKVPEIAPTVDILLGNLEDGVPADQKEEARAGMVQVGATVDMGDTQLWTRVNSLDSPWGPRRPRHPRHRDRRPARRDHGAQGRRRRGHPLRGPAARPARGEGRPHHATDGACHPRDGPRGGQRRGDLRRQPPDAGTVARARRPRGQPGHEDHARRRRPIRATWCATTPTPTTTTRRAPRRSRTCGTTRWRAWSTPAWPTASCRSTGPSATSPTPPRARTSSATPTCSAVWAPGASTRCRSRSPRGCSAPTLRRWPTPNGSSTPWATAPGALMLDGKMEDDASVKQCRVGRRVVRGAWQPATPELAERYGYTS